MEGHKISIQRNRTFTEDMGMRKITNYELRITNYNNKIFLNLNKICVLCGFIMFLFLSPQTVGGDGGFMVISKYIKGDISDDPSSPIWDQIPAVRISLFTQVRFEPRWFDGKVRSVSVRSINNGERISFLLEWEDKTEDSKGDGFKDGAAIEFPVGKEKAHYSHASRIEQLPGGKVNIWHWKGDSAEIKDMNAEGLGTLTIRQNKDVTGKGIWSNNKWKAIYSRASKATDANGV